MSTIISSKLKERCEGLCELCATEQAETAYAVSPKNNDVIENEVALCTKCLSIIEGADAGDHWQCLGGSIWNEAQSVQALSYRILFGLKENDWANDILTSVELEEATEMATKMTTVKMGLSHSARRRTEPFSFL